MNQSQSKPGPTPDQTFNLGFAGSEPIGMLEASETVNTVRFLWHCWMDLNNLGGDGVCFGVQHTKFKRHTLIDIPAYPVPDIQSHGRFAVGGFTGDGGIVLGSRAGSITKQKTQMPSESIEAVMTAWGKIGMTHLASLTANNNEELRRARLLFEAVLFSGKDDEERGADVPLERLVHWFENYAPRFLARALREGVEYQGTVHKLPAGSAKIGEQMIAEMLDGARRADDFAINDSTGVLPTTKSQLEAAAKNMPGGKAGLDGQDRWLLDQYPSFSLDTEIERSQKAMQSAIREINAPTEGGNNDVVKQLLEQQAEDRKLFRETLASLQPKPAPKGGQQPAS